MCAVFFLNVSEEARYYPFMNLIEMLRVGQRFLVEGSMYDRLLRSAGDLFDAQLAHLGLLYSPKGKDALRAVYEEYIFQANKTNLPMAVFTPTWRANQSRVAESTLKDCDVNRDSAKFVCDLRSANSHSARIFVGGLIGCKNDCYDAASALDTDEADVFHSPQIEVLADSPIDFLFASTLPAYSEALGIARAMGRTGKPYVLSFVADKTGCILDGISLADAITKLDRELPQKPLGYFVNCTHPQVLLEGLSSRGDGDSLKGRLIGFQGNTSRRDPREFDALTELESESPAQYAAASLALQRRLGVSMLGGCCGTGPDHIYAIGEMLRAVGTQD